MTVRRFTLVLALLALLTAGVSANDAPGPKGFAIFGHWFSGPQALLFDPIVQDATGLEADALREALLEGSTLSELIVANGGDVDAVIASLVVQATEAIHARAATTIEGLEAGISEALEESHRRRFPWWRRRNPVRERFGAWGMDETITAATGLNVAQLNSALLQGSTLADLIEANDGNIAVTLSALVEQATKGVNEAAAARVGNYEEALIEAFEADYSDSSRRWRKWRPRHGAFFSFWGSYDSSQPATEDGSIEALGESEES